jgi:hypothetical protein
MPLADNPYSADFFNNIAAVCVVLLFAKFVTHRSRTPGGRQTGVLVLHVVCVVAAAVGTVFALIATVRQSAAPGLTVTAWVSLGVAGLTLMFDVLWDDIRRHRSAAPAGAEARQPSDPAGG